MKSYRITQDISSFFLNLIGVDLDALAKWNPGLTSNGPFTAGTIITVPADQKMPERFFAPL